MRAAVITVSDSSFRGERVDVSGTVVADLLRANAFVVISHLVVPDEQREIEDALREQCAVANLVLTTGGTGVAPRVIIELWRLLSHPRASKPGRTGPKSRCLLCATTFACCSSTSARRSPSARS